MRALLFWGVYFPLLKLLVFMASWVPKLRERKAFERKNSQGPRCESFLKKGLKADLCFEFSSEGEFQQVACLIDDALKAGKRLELVFFSPSVEKAIEALGEKYPTQIRYLRYPLVDFSPWGEGRCFSQWVSSPRLILVRYDLFPEFLLWAGREGKELTILWASFKKERVGKKGISFLKRSFFQAADQVIYASRADQELGQGLGFQGTHYDFRMESIRRRLERRQEKFKGNFPQYFELKEQFERYPRHKRLIIGNAWPSDLFLLRELPRDFYVLVVPHQLSPGIMEAMRQGLSGTRSDAVELKDGMVVPVSGTVILNKKGVLCELYADFGLAYVGGGFETSVHSLLEPLVAGSELIACGKLHHRSTEYDVAWAMGKVTEVKSAGEFCRWMGSPLPDRAGELSSVFDQYVKFRKDVISC